MSTSCANSSFVTRCALYPGFQTGSPCPVFSEHPFAITLRLHSDSDNAFPRIITSLIIVCALAHLTISLFKYRITSRVPLRLPAASANKVTAR